MISIDKLLTNAVEHAKENSEIKINIKDDNKYFIISINNIGSVISNTEIPSEQVARTLILKTVPDSSWDVMFQEYSEIHLSGEPMKIQIFPSSME